MPNCFDSQVKRALKQNDYSLLRKAKGSHEVWRCSKSGKKITVPHKIKSRHTANAILKSAHIKHKF